MHARGPLRGSSTWIILGRQKSKDVWSGLLALRKALHCCFCAASSFCADLGAYLHEVFSQLPSIIRDAQVQRCTNVSVLGSEELKLLSGNVAYATLIVRIMDSTRAL